MEDIQVVINEFLSLCAEADKVLDEAIDILLDSYKNTPNEKNLLKEFSTIQKLSDAIKNKTKDLDVNNSNKSLKILDEVELLLDKRTALVENLKYNCFQFLLKQ